MEPRIHYARTSDGVSIAYWSVGQGPPLVILPVAAFSHVQLEWQIPEYRRWYELLARDCTVIRYDQRGCGLSDRLSTDLSLDAQMRDLEAVMDAVGLENCSVWAPIITAPLGIHFAVKHPERVSHLILWCGFARYADWAESPVVQGLLAILDKDWELFTETVSHAALGWTASEPAQAYAAYMRESVSPEGARAMFAALQPIDVEHELPEVSCPTLVIHRRRVAFPPVELSRSLASRIPTARFLLFEGTSLASFLGDAESEMGPIMEFLLGTGASNRVLDSEAGTVRTILFTDVAGSTALTHRLGDQTARDLLRAHEQIVREHLRAHAGSEVKTMGDGFMASFGSAARAVECAVAMQRSLAEHNESAPEPIDIRIGLNAGEPIAEDDDLFGTAVITAARICQQAEAGQILISNVVRELAAGKGFAFTDQGEQSLKGIGEPVRVYEVAWQD